MRQRVTGSAGVSYLWQETRLSLDLLGGTGLRRGFANTQQGPNYATLNPSLEQRIHLGGSRYFKLRFDVVNLLDKVYELRDGSGIGVGAPQFGARRGFYGSVAFDFYRGFMIQIFLKGGPVMWPLLVTSLVALTVVLERLFFAIGERRRRRPGEVEKLFTQVEKGGTEEAIRTGRASPDYVARVLTYALIHRDEPLAGALLRAANRELKRFNRGLSVLDTVITLAPLLGLLGTVTGMIRAFNLLGGQELGAPTAITGGIAEALIATAFGLLIAIIALIPFNFLNSEMEEARHEIEDAASRLDALLANAAPALR